MPKGMTDQAAQEILDIFNDTWPPGSAVVLALDFGDRAQTTTAGPAFIAGENLMVSLVEYGQYKLDRVIPLPAIEKEFYLPIPCPVCGRNRLLYLSNEVRCEKCGADTETINLYARAMPTEEQGELEEHQELLTRDGRKVGNAFVTSVQGDDIEIVTNFGNKLCLSLSEVHSLFYVGEIQDIAERQETQRSLLLPPASTKTMNGLSAATLALEFNKAYKFGTRVMFIRPDGYARHTTLTREARAIDGFVLVGVACWHGVCGLERIIPLPAPLRPVVAMPDPPDKMCDICHGKVDVPTAHYIGPDDGWSLYWDCASQCDEHELLIDWPFASDAWANAGDFRRVGFTVEE